MPQYLLSVHMVEGEPEPSPEQMDQAYRDVDALNDELRRAGSWVFAGGLRPPAAAHVVYVGNGGVRTTDGPFAGNKEQLGGFWIIKSPDLDAALSWAGKATQACRAPVEVRPFQEEPGS